MPGPENCFIGAADLPVLVSKCWSPSADLNRTDLTSPACDFSGGLTVNDHNV